MLNLLLGFFIADFLFSLILFFRRDIVRSLDRNYVLASIIIDIILIGIIIFSLKNAQRKKIKKS